MLACVEVKVFVALRKSTQALGEEMYLLKLIETDLYHLYPPSTHLDRHSGLVVPARAASTSKEA